MYRVLIFCDLKIPGVRDPAKQELNFLSKRCLEGESGMKKYGLQLRVPPSQQKKQSKPPLHPLIFSDDIDEDIGGDIARQAVNKKVLRDVRTWTNPWSLLRSSILVLISFSFSL